MIDEKLLEEKLKYLVIINCKPHFEVISFNVEFDYKSNNTIIDNYDVNIKIDWLKGIDHEVSEFTRDIKRMGIDLQKIIGEYVITSNGKIVKGSSYEKAWVSEGLIWQVDYLADEKHNFDMSFRVNYTED